MAALVNAVLACLLSVLVLLGPGVVLARVAWLDEELQGDLRGLVLALAWGAGAVPTLAFFLHLAGGPFVSIGTMAAAAIAHYVVAAWIALRRRSAGQDASWRWWVQPLAAAPLGVLVPVAGVGALWLLRYDNAPLPPESSCIYGAALVATGHREEGLSLLFENLEDARLGNSGVIAGFVALYGEVGFRLLFAACGALLAAGGMALGRAAAPGTRWAGLVGLLVLPLNPWVLSLPQADENVLALAFSAPALALAMQRRPPWLLVGALVGLVLAMRHVLVLSVPAVLLLAWWGRGLGRVTLGLALGTAFEHLHHLLALGSVLRFESNAQFPALPYRFLGLPFRWEGMVNWPLHTELVRTPWNPFPMLMAWPLHALAAWGSLACAVLIAGGILGARRDRRGAWFWAAWVGPSMVLLGLQEAWDFPNKMGVALVVFAALPWCAVWGVRALASRPARFVVVAVALIVPGLLRFSGPVGSADARYYDRFPAAPRESEAVVIERAAGTRLGVLPSAELLVRHGPLFDRDHLGHLVATLRDDTVRSSMHPWSWGATETPARGAPVTLAITSGGPGGGSPTFGLTDAAPHVDLTDGAAVVTGLDVPWDVRSPVVYGLAGERATAITLHPVMLDESAPCGCTYTEEGFAGRCEDRCSVLFDVAGVAPRGHGVSGTAPFLVPGAIGGPPWPPARAMEGAELRVRVRGGAVSFGIVELPFANRLRLWRLVVSDQGVTVLDGPRWPWHG